MISKSFVVLASVCPALYCLAGLYFTISFRRSHINLPQETAKYKNKIPPRLFNAKAPSVAHRVHHLWMHSRGSLLGEHPCLCTLAVWLLPQNQALEGLVMGLALFSCWSLLPPPHSVWGSTPGALFPYKCLYPGSDDGVTGINDLPLQSSLRSLQVLCKSLQQQPWSQRVGLSPSSQDWRGEVLAPPNP